MLGESPGGQRCHTVTTARPCPDALAGAIFASNRGMIRWPDERTLRPVAREALARFRETTAALELAATNAHWEISALPWLDEAPLRVQLQNQDNDVVDFTLDEYGLWRLEREPRHLLPRSAEALAEDARALVPDEATAVVHL